MRPSRAEPIKTLGRPSNGEVCPAGATAEKLLLELQIHQAELEAQNDELRAHRSELERSRAKFSDLYDLAPAGYYTLDKLGRILEVNLTGALMLGVNRDRLIRRSFRSFVDSSSQVAFRNHLKTAFQKRSSQSWDLKILKAGGAPFFARLESGPVGEDLEHRPCCRIALLDTTERKKSEEALQRAHQELEGRVQKRTKQLSETNRALEGQILKRQYTEHALQQAHDELECRVQRRTAELLHSNEALATEVAQRLESEHARYLVLRKLIDVQESERGRIARELHDQFGQGLAALSLSLKRIGQELPASSALRPQVGRALATLGNLMRDSHNIVWNLRPPELDDMGLGAALRSYTKEWTKLSAIPMAFQCRGNDRMALPTHFKTALYRIAQEALTNVLKHARARQVNVLLEHHRDRIALIVEDDGRGFQVDAMLSNSPTAQGRLGLLGMRERAELAGGTLDIESTPGSGTTLFARIPLPAAIV